MNIISEIDSKIEELKKEMESLKAAREILSPHRIPWIGAEQLEPDDHPFVKPDPRRKHNPLGPRPRDCLLPDSKGLSVYDAVRRQVQHFPGNFKERVISRELFNYDGVINVSRSHRAVMGALSRMAEVGIVERVGAGVFRWVG